MVETVGGLGETERGSPVTGVQGELYLRFVLTSGEEFALPAMSVEEVAGISPDRISPVPNVLPVVLGVYNWRGQVIWVGDLSQFVGLPPLNPNRPELSVIVVANGGVTCGLAVERVIGAEFLDVQQLRPPLSSEGPLKTLVQGEWSLNQGTSVLRLLKPQALVEARLWQGVE
ncbi:MAG: chemotaxis protein CheW [Gloeomargarita sp. SKYBB_i_bin120]|nr:chemotaxis protein CheW [Gloeomargarita sp. SKYG98]MCS7292535.1 chemotaxis protein CheW [Gloeomargarita sp. SKYB120]MDW8178096.1 chemotaxis protein CheW [Gloeomargarita sp. SKYBB_i_bin120]